MTAVTGRARLLPGSAEALPTRFELRDADLSFAPEGAAPVTATYRDLTTIAVDQGRLLLVIGDALRIIVEQLGQGLGTLVGELRERRARQQLDDRFIQVPDADRLELVEYRADDEHGVAQIAYHPWGVALLPVDERRPRRLVRRADISSVTAHGATGTVSVAATDQPFELVALGASHERHRARIDGLRQSASADAGAIVTRLLPDASFAVRQAAAALLVDGRPIAPAELGAEAWPAVEAAVLGDPTYEQTFRTLVARGGADSQRWLALAPVRPMDPQTHMAWFLVALPNDLVAFELVSEGAHATYLFRAGGAREKAVAEISECLIDARFLREPIYMTDAELAAPDNLRYRFAIAALPSLRAARSRFVRRLIHTDEQAWSAALDEAIKTGGS